MDDTLNRSNDMSLIESILADFPAEKEKRATAKSLEYLKLKSIYSLFPLPPEAKSLVVNIYAIVEYYNPVSKRLLVWDDTCSDFCIYMSDLEFRGLVIRPGQIIRIHRLELLRNLQCHANNALFIVLFDPFKNIHFSPNYISRKPTITAYDKERVGIMLMIQAEKLLESRLVYQTFKSNKPAEKFIASENPCPHKARKFGRITDVALQVLGVFYTLKNNMIIVGFNGRPFEDSPSFPSRKLPEIQTEMRIKRSTDRFNADHPYTDEVLERLYADDRLTFVIVLGYHVETVIKNNVRPLDVLVFYDLLVRGDLYNEGYYTYTMLDKHLNSKSVCYTEPGSVVAATLREQVKTYLNSYDKLNFSTMLWPFDDSDLNDIDSVEQQQQEEEEEDEQDSNSESSARGRKRSLSTTDDHRIVECQHQQCEILQHEHRQHLWQLLHKPDKVHTNSFFAKSVVDIRSHNDIYRPSLQWQDGGQLRLFARFKRTLPESSIFNEDTNPDRVVEQFFDQFMMVECTASECNFRVRFREFMATKLYRIEQGGALVLDIKNAVRVLKERPNEIDELDWARAKEEEQQSTPFNVCQQEPRLHPTDMAAVVDASHHLSSSPKERQELNDDDDEDIADPSSPLPPPPTTTHENLLVCPECLQSRCRLQLYLHMHLVDHHDFDFIVRLEGPPAARLLNLGTNELRKGGRDIIVAFHAFSTYLNHITFETSECSQKLCWLLQMSGSSVHDGELVVLDVRPLTNDVATAF